MTNNSLRNRIQGKLTHNDVEQVKGYVEVLVGKIEERYGVTKAEARRQIEQWAIKFLAHKAEQSKSDTLVIEEIYYI